MGVDPAEPEAAQGHPPWLAFGPRSPGLGPGQDSERAPGEVQPRRRAIESRRRRQDPFFQGEQDLEQPRGARRREGVADVRLDRADHAAADALGQVAPEGPEAGELDGVADRRAGGVAFDQVDVSRLPAGLLVSGSHGPELPLGVGGEQAAVDVVREADAGDHAVDPIPLAERIPQPLEDEHPRAFAHDQAVGLRPERRGLARGRECPELREPHLRVERVGSGEPAGQHRVGPAFEQLIARQLQGVERRGTSRVERVSPAPEAKGLSHHPSRQAGRPCVERLEGLERLGLDPEGFLERPAQGASGDARRGLGGQDDVAEDDADPRPVDLIGPSVEPGGPTRVEGQVKRRVEPRKLRGVEVQPRRVELEPLHEAATGRVDVVGSADDRVVSVERVEEPATRRDFPRGRDPAFDIGPEPRQVGRVGEDPPDPDDRHPFIRRLHHFASIQAAPLGFGGRRP